MIVSLTKVLLKKILLSVLFLHCMGVCFANNNLGLTREDYYLYKLSYDEKTTATQVQEKAVADNLYAHYLNEYNRRDDAVKQYLDLLKLPLDKYLRGEALRSLAKLKLDNNELSAALQLSNESIKVLNSTDVNSVLLRAQILLSLSMDGEISNEKKDAYLENATQDLETIKSKETSNTLVYEMLARVYLARQDINRVLDCYRTIVDISPRDLNSQVILINILLKANRPKEAIYRLEKIVSQHPSFIQGYLWLSDANLKLFQPREALKWVKEGLLLDPKNKDLLALFDECAIKISNSGGDPVILQYKNFASDFPHSASVQRIYAEKLESVGAASDDTIKQWQRVLSADEDNPDVMLKLADLQIKNKNTSKALSLALDAIKNDPSNTSAYRFVFNIYERDQHSVDAYDLLQKGIRLDPGNGDLYFLLSRLQLRDGKTTESFETIRKGSTVANPGKDLSCAYAKLLSDEGKTTESLKYMQSLYQQNQDDIYVITAYHSLLLDNGMNQQAIEFANTTSERIKRTSKPEYWNLLAQSASDNYAIDVAIQYYSNSLATKEDQPLIIVKLITLLNVTKQTEKCEALLSDPKIVDNISNLSLSLLKASCYWESGDHAKAVSILTEYEKNEKTNLLPVWQMLLDCYLDDNNLDAAKSTIERAEKSLGKKSPDVAILWSYYYSKTKEYKRGLATLNRLLSTGLNSDQQKSHVYYLLGCIYTDMNDGQNAILSYKQSIVCNRMNENALNALGYYYCDNDMNLHEAERLIDSALLLSPLSAHIIDSKGWVLYKLGDCENALIWLERAKNIFKMQEKELDDHISIVKKCLGQ